MRENDLFTATLNSLGEVQKLARRKYAPPGEHIQRKNTNKYASHDNKRASATGQTKKPPGGQAYGFAFHEDWQVIAPETSLDWCHPSAKARLTELKRGKPAPDYSLDLHGLTLAEAGELLAEQLPRWLNQGLRVVRLVHGKGSGARPSIIKAHMPIWFKEHPAVLAYASAAPGMGGSGSLLMLLRKRAS